ncbi:tripartite tricarboxylate transporter TctB family protein [Arvimicrobium flavum]|uniref:tripartite tricarboxylate transporter TctB family protein n=1 Tax=Arvimicrobium flavum TaxID=3393320 RepID=UPI00237B6552|nr:tripartite tricarboxylate transporter TctB family protein [Mesorhizobium shangrilense]
MSRARPVFTDVIGGLVVTIGGIAGLVESWRMPRFEVRKADPFTVPGLTPGLLCLVLTVLGIALLIRAMAGRGGAVALPILTWQPGSAARMIFTLVTVVIYGFVLFGNVPFVIATTIFVFAFTVGAELLNPERKLSLPALSAGALVLAICSSLVVRAVFVEIFLVKLPG